MTGTPTCATGEQYELNRGEARVVVTELAAGLRLYSRGGVDLTETYDDDETAPAGAGLLLAPWGNRVAGGRWVHDGAERQLDITEPERGHAIHGLLRNTGYRLIERDETSVLLAAPIFPQHGYPFRLEHRVRYAIGVDLGLTVTQTLRNLGVRPAPFGLGAHPYLRIGDAATADLTLTVAADTRLTVDDGLIPTGTVPVDGDYDLRSGSTVGPLRLDTGYTDLHVRDGVSEHTLADDGGRSVSLWADEAFGYLQVFVTDRFPGRDRAVAVEPMTAPADAFNSGAGLRWLPPQTEFSARWGMTARLDGVFPRGDR